MSTLAIALAKIALLEARLDALEGVGSPGSGSVGGGQRAPSSSGGEALPDHLLSSAWADKPITKDPRQWKGRSQVNRRYSQAPVEWLDMAASLSDWKAMKGREEVPVRMRDDGKPWHESDTFAAKLLRAWANRARTRTASAPAAPPPAPSSAPADTGADEFPFGANAAPSPKDDVGF